MLANYRLPVCISFLSTDLPILSTLETSCTLYKKDEGRFHLFFNDPGIPSLIKEPETKIHEGLLWLEISPKRVIMTMQGKTGVSYRHFWEKALHGTSRYWYNNGLKESSCLRLRNYTHRLTIEGTDLPESLRVEYELFSENVGLGHYVLYLEIQK